LTKSYKPVMLKAFFKLADREGRVKIDELVREFKNYYIYRAEAGQPLERSASLLANPATASDAAVKRLIIAYPLERFLIKNFIEYFPEGGVLQISPLLWQSLRYYEVADVLERAHEQISYYVARHAKEE
jgi:hypothetical protein